MHLNLQLACGDEVGSVFDAIEKFGGEARFVGGCVRDTVLNRDVNDIDFATNLLPNQVIEALRLQCIKTVPTGLKHGTVTAVINSKSFEITTLRCDTKCDGRHAEVEFTDSWKSDASRRDFTFNALYMDRYGKIYDYFNGLQDLKERKLSFVGNAEERIKEDYLRILRAFRFHAKICIGALSNEILEICEEHSHMILNLSGERVREELFKLLECSNPAPTLKSMQDFNILQKIIPKEVDCEILCSELIIDSYALVKLALLLRSTGDDEIGKHLCNSLRFSKQQQRKLLLLISNNTKIDPSEEEQKKHMYFFGKELYSDLLKVCAVEHGISNQVMAPYFIFAKKFDIPRFPLSGSDLIGIGYMQGKHLGMALKKVQQYWEDTSYTLTKDDLMVYAKKHVNS